MKHELKSKVDGFKLLIRRSIWNISLSNINCHFLSFPIPASSGCGDMRYKIYRTTIGAKRSALRAE